MRSFTFLPSYLCYPSLHTAKSRTETLQSLKNSRVNLLAVLGSLRREPLLSPLGRKADDERSEHRQFSVKDMKETVDQSADCLWECQVRAGRHSGLEIPEC